MGAGQTFPMFVRAEYDPAGNGFKEFEAAALRATQSTKQQFEASFDEISRSIGQALNRGLGADGKLNFDVPGLRRSAEDADAFARASRLAADAADRLARVVGDTSSQTRNFVQAARAVAIQAKDKADALNVEALSG